MTTNLGEMFADKPESLDRLKARIIELNDLSRMDLLIFAAIHSLAFEAQQDKLLPDGYTLESYAERMLIKGSELGATFRAKMNSDKAKAKDPKQAAKQYIFDCWEVWKEEPERYGSKAAFARAMRATDIGKVIDCDKTITDRWIPEWEKKREIIPPT